MIMGGNIFIIVIGAVVALLFCMVGVKRKNILNTIVTLRLMKASKQLADANYREIKALLKDAKPLVRLRFKMLVGTKRYNDYTFNG